MFGMKGVCQKKTKKNLHFPVLSTFTHQCCFPGVNCILRFVLKLHKMMKKREADSFDLHIKNSGDFSDLYADISGEKQG